MSNNVERHANICKLLNEMYCQKNNDYGNSFSKTFKQLGIISAVTRIADKFNRLVEMATGTERKVKDETMRDTLMDLANYAIMTVMELDEEGQKEESSDTKTLIKYKNVLMNLIRSDGTYSIDSSYCGICSLCCHDDVSADKYPCKDCKHCYGNTEHFVLNEDVVEVCR